jgi:hypothetical protein
MSEFIIIIFLHVKKVSVDFDKWISMIYFWRLIQVRRSIYIIDRCIQVRRSIYIIDRCIQVRRSIYIIDRCTEALTFILTFFIAFRIKQINVMQTNCTDYFRDVRPTKINMLRHNKTNKT